MLHPADEFLFVMGVSLIVGSFLAIFNRLYPNSDWMFYFFMIFLIAIGIYLTLVGVKGLSS